MCSKVSPIQDLRLQIQFCNHFSSLSLDLSSLGRCFVSVTVSLALSLDGPLVGSVWRRLSLGDGGGGACACHDSLTEEAVIVLEEVLF